MTSRDDPVSLAGQKDAVQEEARHRPRRNAVRLVAVNTTVQLVARAAGAGIALVQVGVLSHYLHSSGYGQYAFVLSVIGFFGMVTDLGVNNVGVRWLNQSEISERVPALNAMLGARTLLSIVAMLASQVFALLAPIDTLERQGILLTSTLYLLTVPSAVGSLFQADLEMQYLSGAAVAQAVLALALAVALVRLHTGLLPLLTAQLVASAFGACAVYVVVVRRHAHWPIPVLKAGLRMVREALPIGVTTVLNVVYLRIDAILVGLLRTASDVAHYAAATRFIDLATLGSGALVASIYPLMVRVSAEAGREKLRRAYQLSVDAMAFVSIPVAATWCILAPAMISLVYPPDFSPAVNALRILSWVLPPLFFNQVAGAVIVSVHREQRFLWISLAVAILNIGLNLAFIPLYGILAASVITVISEVFVTCAATYLMWMELKFVPSLRSSGLTLLSTAVMAVPVYLLRDVWPAAVVAGGIVYLVASHASGIWSKDQLAGWIKA